jgi:anti-sigma B factor antagonist
MVVVDLLAVTFIDSTGLGVLIGARKRCVADDRTLRVVVAEPRILKVFEITGLTELFDIRPTVAGALDD